MNNDINSKPIKKPSFGSKAWNSVGGAALTTFVAQLPFMIAELSVTIASIRSKNPLGKEAIDFSNKMNEMASKIGLPAALLGGAIGWGEPERKYLKDKNMQLEAENTQLKIRMAASSNNLQKSWTASEQARDESVNKVEQAR